MTKTIVTVAACATLLWIGTAQGAATPAQKCEAAKNKAAGKEAACLTGQRAKEVNGKLPDYATCSTKFNDAFINAETKAGGLCPTTGDAGAIEARVDAQFNPNTAIPKALSGTRFVDDLDGTVTDTKTGLIWEQKTAGTGCPHCVNDNYEWASSGPTPNGPAFTGFLGTLNGGTSSDGSDTPTPCFTGHCDWRLPTVQELAGIIDLSRGNCGGGSGPCIDPAFGTTKANGYWSATTDSSDSLYVWAVFFSNSLSGSNTKSSYGYVRAVRGGL